MFGGRGGVRCFVVFITTELASKALAGIMLVCHQAWRCDAPPAVMVVIAVAVAVLMLEWNLMRTVLR